MFLLLGNLCNEVPQNLNVTISINRSEYWCVLTLMRKLNSPVNPLTPHLFQVPLKQLAPSQHLEEQISSPICDTVDRSFLQETEFVTSAKHPSSYHFLTSYPQAMLQTGQPALGPVGVPQLGLAGNGAAQGKEQNWSQECSRGNY